MKVCKKCNVGKELGEFYTRGGGKLYARCIVCTREGQKIYEEKNRELRNEKQRQQRLVPENKKRAKEYAKEHRGIDANRKRAAIILAAHRKRNPEKHLARKAVKRAIARGNLIRLPCTVCGDLKSEGHHEDYSKPLDVIFYCAKHHSDRHRELRKLNFGRSVNTL